MELMRTPKRSGYMDNFNRLRILLRDLGGDIQVRSQVAQWNTTGNLRLFAEEEAVAAGRILAGINVL